MGERKQGEKPDCRAWVTSLFGGCLVDHWFEFEVHEAPRRRPQRLGFPSQGLGTLKPRFRSPAPSRDAAMPSTEQCGCTIHWHTFASPEREESIHNRIRHSCKPHPIHTRGLIDPSSFSFLSPCPAEASAEDVLPHPVWLLSSEGPVSWTFEAPSPPWGGRKPGSCRHPRVSARAEEMLRREWDHVR